VNRRDTVLALLALGAAGAPIASLAQQKDRTRRVGIVWGGSKLTVHRYEEAFLAGMTQHGYQIGRNLMVHSRYAEGNPARYPALVDEVLALRPDVLIGANTGVATDMKRKTTTIPIVLATSGDPVGDGLVQSLARPGGNVTGVSLQLGELGAKHIELMAEVLPRMRSVALLADPSAARPQNEEYERLARDTTAARGLALQVHPVAGPDEIRRAFGLMETHRADALLVGLSPRFNAMRREIGRSAANLRLPSIGFVEEYPQDGGLMSYGPSFVEATRRTAYFVDRILKGAKPDELPIERPTKFLLVLNATVAKALGVEFPGSIQLRADRVIE